MPVPLSLSCLSLSIFLSLSPSASSLAAAPVAHTSPTQHHHLICKLGLSTCCARPTLPLLPSPAPSYPPPLHEHVASILHFPKRLLPLPRLPLLPVLLLLLVYFAYIFANFGLVSPRLTAAARRVYSFIVYSQLSCSPHPSSPPPFCCCCCCCLLYVLKSELLCFYDSQPKK